MDGRKKKMYHYNIVGNVVQCNKHQKEKIAPKCMIITESQLFRDTEWNEWNFYGTSQWREGSYWKE